MWSLVARCPQPLEAYYPALLATLIKRGCRILDAEWLRMVRVVHGPVVPRPTRGSRKSIEVRTRGEAGHVRIDAIVENTYTGLYLGAVASLSLSAALLATYSQPLAIASSLAAVMLAASTLLAQHIDFNWVSSLAEEACEASISYLERSMHTPPARCESRGVSYECIVECMDCELLDAALASIGFRRVGSSYVTPSGLRVMIECGTPCKLVVTATYAMTLNAATALARLVSMLASG